MTSGRTLHREIAPTGHVRQSPLAELAGGLQEARRLVGAGLTRLQHAIQQCEQTREWNGPNL